MERPFPPDETPPPGGSSERVTLRLSPQAKEALEKIKEIGGYATLGEAARRAIGDELFLLSERKAGWTVLLRKDDKYREVAWPSL